MHLHSQHDGCSFTNCLTNGKAALLADPRLVDLSCCLHSVAHPPIDLSQGLARPYLKAMDAVPATLRIGIHIRMGDSALANTIKSGELRYKPGCAFCRCRG